MNLCNEALDVDAGTTSTYIRYVLILVLFIMNQPSAALRKYIRSFDSHCSG